MGQRDTKCGWIRVFTSYSTTVLILTGFFALYGAQCQAQWLQDLCLTETAADSWTNDFGYKGVVADGQNIHVVYEDDFHGKLGVYYRFSDDGGATWQAATHLSTNDGKSISPTIARSGNTLHVVWGTYGTGMPQVFYTRSQHGGSQWDAPVPITSGMESSETALLAVSGNNIYVFYEDFRDGDREIYMRASSDGGQGWGSNQRVTNARGMSYTASAWSEGDTLYLTWHNDRSGNTEIFFKSSIDAGVTWSEDTQLSSSVASIYPKVTANGATVHIAYAFTESGTNTEIAYVRSSDAGATWEQVVQLTRALSYSWAPSIAVAGDNVYLVWSDSRNDHRSAEIFNIFSSDAGASWSEDVAVISNEGSAWAPCIAADGTGLQLLWCDDRTGAYQVYFSSNPTGEITDMDNAERPFAAGFRLGQNYPNPFNPSTAISFELPRNMQVTLIVTDGLGREVQRVIDGAIRSGGRHTVTFESDALPSGVYYYRLLGDGRTETRKMLLLR